MGEPTHQNIRRVGGLGYSVLRCHYNAVSDETDTGGFTHIGIVQHGFVRDVSFPVQRGGVVYLFGLNNTGKSTILDAITTLDGRPVDSASWVIAYARSEADIALRDTNEKRPAWYNECLSELNESRYTWFGEDEGINPKTDSPRGWLRMLPSETRDPRDDVLAGKPCVAITTAFGSAQDRGLGPANAAGFAPADGGFHMVAWTAITPDPRRTPTSLPFDPNRLRFAVPGRRLYKDGNPDTPIGPRRALEHMPSSIRDELEQWSDDFTWNDMDDWEEGEFPDKPPTIATDIRAAPVSWLLSPSRILPTLDSLIEPVGSQITVLSAADGMVDSANWPKGAKTSLHTAIACQLRLDEYLGSHWPPLRDSYFYVIGGQRHPHPSATTVLEAFSRAATEMLPAFVRDSHDSHFVAYADPATRTIRMLVRTIIHGNQRDLEVSELAEGLRLWHLLAIRSVLEGESMLRFIQDTLSSVGVDPDDDIYRQIDDIILFGQWNTFIVIDEPERHLHPTAQREAAKWLQDFAARTNTYVVAATHSPAMLSAGGARYVHVERRHDDSVEAIEIDAIDLRRHFATNSRLGFDQGELLTAIEQYIVVEGEHEEIVLTAWCGDVLARSLICPMRGTQQRGGVNLQLEALMKLAPKPVAFLLDFDPVVEGIRDLPDAFDLELIGEDRIRFVEEHVAGFNRKKHASWLDLLFWGKIPVRSPICMLEEPDIVFLLDEQLIGEGAKRKYTHAKALKALTDERGSNEGIKPFLMRYFGLRTDVFDAANIKVMADASTGPGRDELRKQVASLIEKAQPPASH